MFKLTILLTLLIAPVANAARGENNGNHNGNSHGHGGDHDGSSLPLPSEAGPLALGLSLAAILKFIRKGK